MDLLHHFHPHLLRQQDNSNSITCFLWNCKDTKGELGSKFLSGNGDENEHDVIMVANENKR